MHGRKRAFNWTFRHEYHRHDYNTTRVNIKVAAQKEEGVNDSKYKGSTDE